MGFGVGIVKGKEWSDVMNRILYIAVGLVLLTGTLVTGEYGLSKANIKIYKLTLSQQEKVDELGFNNFNLADYPVAFYAGKYDYVMTTDGESNEINKRKSVLETLAATAYPVEEHYEVIVPTVEQFESLYALWDSAQNVEGLSEKEQTALETISYGEKEQAATIWHEAFHAYQLTVFERQIKELLSGNSFSEKDFGENLIVENVDSNQKVKDLLKQQLKLLKKATGITDIDTLKETVLQYKELEDERRTLLSEETVILEEYYNRLEGSACYVEAYVYKNLYSEEEFQSRYMDGMDVYHDGSSKYYEIGMAQCLILDKLDSRWKDNYDFSASVMDLVYERLGISDGI